MMWNEEKFLEEKRLGAVSLQLPESQCPLSQHMLTSQNYKLTFNDLLIVIPCYLYKVLDWTDLVGKKQLEN